MKPGPGCPEVYRLNSKACGSLPITSVRFMGNHTSSAAKEHILLATCKHEGKYLSLSFNSISPSPLLSFPPSPLSPPSSHLSSLPPPLPLLSFPPPLLSLPPPLPLPPSPSPPSFPPSLPPSPDSLSRCLGILCPLARYYWPSLVQTEGRASMSCLSCCPRV